MTQLSEAQARLLELFEQLPAEVKTQALQAVEHLTERNPYAGPFGWLMGYHYTGTGASHARYVLDISDMHLNQSGVAHGGVLCTLADAVMGTAAYNALEPDQRCVTAELKVNFLKPIPPGRITADATVMHKGTRLIVTTAEVHNADGDLVGVALGTFAIIARTKRQGAE